MHSFFFIALRQLWDSAFAQNRTPFDPITYTFGTLLEQWSVPARGRTSRSGAAASPSPSGPQPALSSLGICRDSGFGSLRPLSSSAKKCEKGRQQLALSKPDPSPF